MRCGARVVIVVLNWNQWRLTDRALRTVERLEPGDHRVIVVDNGSTDDSRQRIGERHPGVVLVPLDRNRGFAGGMNAGIRHAMADGGAEYVWLLNNDTEASPGALAAMLAVAEADRRTGAVGSILAPLGTRRRTIFGGGRVGRWTGVPRHCLTRVPDSQLDYIVGASLLLRCEALREVGLLDEAFFLYWEDVDLSCRLRRQGWRLAVADTSVVAHVGKGTLGDRDPAWDAHYIRSAARFFRLHSPVPALPIVAGSIAWMLKHVASGRFARAVAVARALWAERPGRARRGSTLTRHI